MCATSVSEYSRDACEYGSKREVEMGAGGGMRMVERSCSSTRALLLNGVGAVPVRSRERVGPVLAPAPAPLALV